MRKVRKRMCLELYKGEEDWTWYYRDVGVFSTLKVRAGFLHAVSWICMWRGYMILISCETGEGKSQGFDYKANTRFEPYRRCTVF